MKKNVLFLLIDGCRAREIFDTGNGSVTPNLDSLKKNGISYTNCFSSVDGTTMSLNCLFNSLNPNKTGLRSKKVLLTTNNYLEQLKNNDYHIYGFIPKVSSFDNMVDFFENSNNSYFAGPPVVHISDTKNEIIKLINNIKETNPWFCFIHLLDNSALRQELPPYGIQNFYNEKFGETDYDKMLSSIDFGIGEILKCINLKDTIVIITSDHGSLIPFENKKLSDFEPSFKKELDLGKKLLPKSTHKISGKLISNLKKTVRNYRFESSSKELSDYEKRSRLPYFKQSLFDENIQIPLIISNLELEPNSIDDLMSNMDIFPTLFEIIGIKNIKNDIDGFSYFPKPDQNKIENKMIFLHTMPHEKIEEDDLEGIRTRKYKFFRSSTHPEKNYHLYDIEIDPLENFNIVDKSPDIVKNLLQKIKDFKDQPLENISDISDEEIRKIEKELKKLGYM